MNELDFIMVPLVVGICVAGTYGLFELYARRKERIMIIEKIGEKLDASAFEGKNLVPSFFPKFSFSALKAGCLLAGAGLGLLVGFLINVSMLANNVVASGIDKWAYNKLCGIAYGASVLLFGGASLIIAFIIELRIAKKKNEENEK
jgi:hypothetical protein